MFRDPFGKTIRHKIQSDVVLEERFKAREHQRKPLSRVGDLFHEFIPGSGEAGFRDGDERCPILLGREQPFHGGGTPVSRPLDDDALVRLELDDPVDEEQRVSMRKNPID